MSDAAKKEDCNESSYGLQLTPLSGRSSSTDLGHGGLCVD